jgi:hypothetical protein
MSSDNKMNESELYYDGIFKKSKYDIFTTPDNINYIMSSDNKMNESELYYDGIFKKSNYDVFTTPNNINYINEKNSINNNSMNIKNIINNLTSFLNKPCIFNTTVGKMLLVFVYVLFVCSFVIIKHNPFNILSLVEQLIDYIIIIFGRFLSLALLGVFFLGVLTL